MKFKFLDWYTQAIGSTLGIIACVYAYLNGYMFVYTNIGNNFDYLGFKGVISSYLLLPLCILTLSLSLIKSYISNKEISNTKFESINVFVIILTTIIGFMGANIYFLIPAVLILFNLISPNIYNRKNLQVEEKTIEFSKTIEFDQIDDVNLFGYKDSDKVHINNANDSKVLKVKQEMAIDLLMKDSSKQFIIELTGFTLDELNTLEKELGIINN